MNDYFIPHNYKDNGKIFGMFDKKHLTRALLWWAPATVALFYIPILPLKRKCFLEILLVCPPAIVILLGYLDILGWLRDHKQRAGAYLRPDQPEPEASAEEPGKKRMRKATGIRYGDLVPVQRIKHGFVTRTDGVHVRILSITPLNFKLKTRLEQKAIILAFEEFLKSVHLSFQLTVLTQEAEIASYTAPLEALRKQQPDPTMGALIESYRDLIASLEENGAVTRRFLLSYTFPLAYKQKPEDVSDKAVRRYFTDMDERIGKYLADCGNQLVTGDDPDFQCAQLLNTALCRNNYDLERLDTGGWGGLKAYADEVTPRRLDASHPGYLGVDDKFVTTLVVEWLPYKVGAVWLEDLVSFGEGVNISIHYRAADPEKVNKELAMAIGNTVVKRKQAGENQQDLQSIENCLLHARYIREQMGESKALYFITIYLSLCASSEEGLEKLVRDVSGKVASKGMTARRCDYIFVLIQFIVRHIKAGRVALHSNHNQRGFV